MEDAAGEVGIGGLMIGLGLFSLISTTTASDVRNVLATDAACSKQHLTTCVYMTKRVQMRSCNRLISSSK